MRAVRRFGLAVLVLVGLAGCGAAGPSDLTTGRSVVGARPAVMVPDGGRVELVVAAAPAAVETIVVPVAVEVPAERLTPVTAASAAADSSPGSYAPYDGEGPGLGQYLDEARACLADPACAP